MTPSTLGLLSGLMLGIAAAAGGFRGFLIALLLGAVGWLVGGQVAGELDLTRLRTPRRRG